MMCLFKDKTEKLIGGLFAVQNEVGLGHDEEAYHRAFVLWLEEHVQIFDYLKARQDQIGLLVNMGLGRVVIERIMYEPCESAWQENWGYWDGRIQGDEREAGLAVRQALKSIYEQHQTGYGSEVMSNLVRFALLEHGLKVEEAPVGQAFYKGQKLKESRLDCLLVNDCMVLVCSALHDDNTFNIGRGLAFMRALGREWGIACNFGKKEVYMDGLVFS
jgi:hypothetical protein